MQASKVSLPYKHSVEMRLFWTEQTPEVSVVPWNCLINPIGNVYIYKEAIGRGNKRRKYNH